jgi:hypothetical protein
MKYRALFVGMISLLSFVLMGRVRQNDFPALSGPYLGQKPPGLTPEIFAPGVVSTPMNEHSPAAFSPDGTELFCSATDG